MTYYDWPPRYTLERDRSMQDRQLQQLAFEKVANAMLDSKLREVHGKLALIENKIDSIATWLDKKAGDVLKKPTKKKGKKCKKKK